MNPTIVSRAWYVHQTHKNVRKALLLVVCEMVRRLRTQIFLKKPYGHHTLLMLSCKTILSDEHYNEKRGDIMLGEKMKA